MWSLIVPLLAITSTVDGVIRRRDSSAPCDDFYEHVCRDWKSQNPIPEGRSSWSKNARAELQLAEEASEILLTSMDLSHLEQQARILHGTCLLLMQRSDCPTPNHQCIEKHKNVIYDTPFDAKELTNSSGAAKETCLRHVSMHIPGAIESIYLRLPSRLATVDDFAVERMFGDVKEAAVEVVRSTKWLLAATKNRLVTKLSEIRLYGRPAFIERVAIANKCHSNLNLTWSNSLEQHSRLLGWAGDYAQCWPFGASNPLTKWPEAFFISSLHVNAHYSREKNYVALYPAYFHHEDIVSASSRGLDRLEEALYGTLGYVLGHEFAHAIDGKGIRYDKYGNECNWIPAHSMSVFRKKLGCLECWYSSQPVPGTNGSVFVNGTRTLNENMADLDGLKFASKECASRVMCRRAALDIRRKRLRLPATSKQKFFKSFAEADCENITPSEAKLAAARNVHSPLPVRVNEALRNNDEFAEAYGCKLGGTMNPAKKCYVWADELIR